MIHISVLIRRQVGAGITFAASLPRQELDDESACLEVSIPSILVKRVGNGVGVEVGAGMKFLNGMQQFRAHTGGYKDTAVPAGGLHQPGMLRA